ncbi:MAG: FtsW/RodA/SpoVE family cell cycle protein [Salinivirgaceae bacterium]|jgi:cell division protein FtsW|nr:FtsW/RodA/SpoVE family cell cycle protein [Bacteroidales bacterium]
MKTVFTYLKGDRVIWVITIMLCLVSILVVYSSTGTLAYKQAGGNTFYYLSKQLLFVGISLLTVFITHRINYKALYTLSKYLYYASIPLLIYTLVRGVSINEAARWITLPGGFSFQTSDLAKLALMMYLATQISLKQPDIKDFKKGFVPLLIPIGLTCMLILPANFSTAALIFVSSMVLLYIGRVRIKHLSLLAGVGVVGIGIFILVALNMPDSGRVGTWKRRIENFVSKDGENFQADQAKIAVATGGMFGKGPGQSVQRNILPHPYSDFIFAIIIEEYGLITGIFIMSLYLILLFRSVALIKKCPTTFPAFLVAGMVILIVLQAFAHIGVNTGVFPVTGQTLPMISMGGTSMIINGIQIGIILSVSKEILKQSSANAPSVQTTNETDNEVEDEGNVTDKIID